MLGLCASFTLFIKLPLTHDFPHSCPSSSAPPPKALAGITAELSMAHGRGMCAGVPGVIQPPLPVPPAQGALQGSFLCSPAEAPQAWAHMADRLCSSTGQQKGQAETPRPETDGSLAPKNPQRSLQPLLGPLEVPSIPSPPALRPRGKSQPQLPAAAQLWGWENKGHHSPISHEINFILWL